MSKELEQLENWIDDNSILVEFSTNGIKFIADLRRKLSELKALEGDYQSQEPKQTEVSEKEYIPSDAFADELSVWKEKDYALKIKLREAVEFAEWCVINANPIFPNKGQWQYSHNCSVNQTQTYTTQELFDIFNYKRK